MGAQKKKWTTIAVPVWLKRCYEKRRDNYISHYSNRADKGYQPPGSDMSQPAIWCFIARDYEAVQKKRSK